MEKTELREIYYCEVCGNVVEVLNEGAKDLTCCGQKMVKLEAKTEDATTEKHVPYIQETDKGVLVKIGQNAAHPMLEKHYIKFIEVHTTSGIFRQELNPGDAPEAEFPVKKSEILYALEWCNLHGLWKG
ncbi:MAG: desulfoferrodoxin [Candidatus Cloacimonetes bacterium]|nr:desulfoferrodoxin [Candidatus Cloacimonadota bacterium]